MNLIKEANATKQFVEKDAQIRNLLNALVSNQIELINNQNWLSKDDAVLQEMCGVSIKTLIDATKGMIHSQTGKVENHFQPVFKCIAQLEDAKVYVVQGSIEYSPADRRNSSPKFADLNAKIMPTIQDIRQIRTNILLEIVKDKMLDKTESINSYFKKQYNFNKNQLKDIISLYDDYKDELLQEKLRYGMQIKKVK